MMMMRAPAQAFLILNSGARRGHRLARAMTDALQGGRLQLRRVVYATTDAELRRAFAKALDSHYELIIIGGGDGTISAAVSYFAGTDKIIGYLPLGTTNNFARSAGLPLDPLAAVRRIQNSRVVTIDTAVADGRRFGNALTIGLASRATRRTPALLKRWFGRYAYLMVGALQFWTVRAFGSVVIIDGVRHEFRSHQLIILNGAHHGGLRTDPGSSLTDGLLTLHVVGGATHWSLLRSLMRLRFFKKAPVKRKRLFYGREIIIQTDRPRRYSLDGERGGRTPVIVRVSPGSLRLVV